MRRFRLRSIVAGLAASLLLVGTAWAQITVEVAEEDVAIQVERPRSITITAPGVISLSSPVQLASKYWLGMMCRPAEETLRRHLDLDEGQGLVVQHVVPEGPADKAGIERHDILLAVGDHDLGSVEDLFAVLREAETDEGIEELLFELRRPGDEEEEVAVQPELRPKSDMALPVFGGGDANTVRGWLQRIDPNGNLNQLPKRFRLMHPGRIIQLHDNVALPNNLQISVQRDNDGPTRIHVQRDDDEWDITEEGIEELPDDIRPHVERMLKSRSIAIQAVPLQQGRRIHIPDFRLEDGEAIRKRIERMLPEGWQLTPPHEDEEGLEEEEGEEFGDSRRGDRWEGFERHMDQLNRQLKEMMEQLEELRHHHEAEDEESLPEA